MRQFKDSLKVESTMKSSSYRDLIPDDVSCVRGVTKYKFVSRQTFIV